MLCMLLLLIHALCLTAGHCAICVRAMLASKTAVEFTAQVTSQGLVVGSLTGKAHWRMSTGTGLQLGAGAPSGKSGGTKGGSRAAMLADDSD